MIKIKKILIVFLSVILLIVSVSFNNVEAQSRQFKDVKKNNSFYKYIHNLNNQGIIKGYEEDNTFRPNNNLTRAQAAKMIVLAAGINTKNVGSNFRDVKDNREPGKLKSYDYVSAAYEANIIKGYEDGTFKPNNPVTRAQIAKMATLAFNLMKDGSPSPFKDVEKLGSVATKEYIYVLSSLDIVKGYGTEFRPRNNVTRGQFSKIVSEAMKKHNPNIKVYTVIVDNNGETSVHRVEHGKDLTLPKPKPKKGYDFTRWSHNGKNIQKDLNIKAAYARSKYTVTIIDSEGSETQEVHHGEGVYLPYPSDKEGYDFVKWDHSGKNITSDLTIKAIYKKNANWKHGFEVEGNDTYYYEDGTLIKGLTTIDNKEYYFNEYDGKMQTGIVHIEKFTYYYFNDNGVREHGFKTIGDVTYYFDPIEGRVRNKFFDVNDNTYYFDLEGEMATQPKSVNIDGEWIYHFFDKDGVWKTGFIVEDNTTYYFDPVKGKVERDFAKIDGKTYYFSWNGKMHTGKLNLDGDNYFFNDKGVMHLGWLNQDDKIFYYDPKTGKQIYGFLELNNHTYYFDYNGEMRVGPVTINNGEDYDNYSFNANGEMEFGFINRGDNTYFYDYKTGKQLYGTQTINNKEYYFYPKNSSFVYPKGALLKNDWNNGSYYGIDGQKISSVGTKKLNNISDFYSAYNSYLGTPMLSYGNVTQPDMIHYYVLDNNLNVVLYREQKLKINTYDKNMNLIQTQSIDLPFDKFGNMLHAEDGNFYVLSGQNNEERNDNKTVVRVLKYNSKWKLLDYYDIKGSASNSTKGIEIPFDGGTARMDMSNNELTIHMARQMYMTSDGLSHQGNISFVIDTQTMTEITGRNKPFVSHSFNQYVKHTNDRTIYIDHGDANPRVMSAYNSENKNMINLFALAINDNVHYNYTGAMLSGFEVGKNNGLVVGASKPQTQTILGITGNDPKLRDNIYLITFNHELTKRELKWITNYHPEESTVYVGEPKLVKVNDNRFVIVYSEKENDEVTLNYKLIDEKGNILLTEKYPGYILPGSSQPIVYNGNLVWINSHQDHITSKYINYITEIPIILD